MKNNYYNEIQNEIQFFVEKFKQIGWKQEDEGYITKRLPFLAVGFVMNYYDAKDVIVSGSKVILLFKRFIAYASKEVLFLLHVRSRQFLPTGLKKTDNFVCLFLHWHILSFKGRHSSIGSTMLKLSH